MDRTRSRLYSLLGLALAACTPEPSAEPVDDLYKQPQRFVQMRLAPTETAPDPEEGKMGKLDNALAQGVGVKRKGSGGRADGIVLGGLQGSELGDAGGAGGLGSRGYGVGGGGSGASGLGMGGIGTRGRGYGVGGGTDGKAVSARQRSQVSISPFAYAGVELPYNGGTPGKFELRPDATVNRITETHEDHLSTFGVDVDTAAYSMARRSIRAGQLPEPSSVRPEELINYFHYDYEAPSADGELFGIEADGARAPIGAERYLLRVGIQAKTLEESTRPAVNLVFLVDTSCSMTGDDRLELAKEGLRIAVRHLGARDKVAISTYAGGVALVLGPTPATEVARIDAAIAKLNNGGGTAMESGMVLAYGQALKMQTPGSFTRVIVCSDGDANIGATSPEAMLAGIAEYTKRGVTLSTIGFGDGNYKDAMMEQLADKGNGNYYYVDSPVQARRVFGRDFKKMILEVAKDVKIQVELDGDAVLAYRLVGYENRAIADKDFRNDRVDAGEIGAGHQVTALYELTLREGAVGKLATIRLRAKRPDGEVAKETALVVPVSLVKRAFASAPADLRFAAAVMGAAEILRKSEYAKDWTVEQVIEIARSSGLARDPDRGELVELMGRVGAMVDARASLRP